LFSALIISSKKLVFIDTFYVISEKAANAPFSLEVLNMEFKREVS